MKRSALSILCTASLALTAAFALEGRCQAASRDLFFGDNGVVAFSGGGSGWAATAQQADGKLLHCADAGSGIKLSRMHFGGSMDTDFGTGGTVDIAGGVCRQVLVLANQKIVALGYSGGEAVAWRFNSDGSMDTTFDEDGITTSSAAGNFLDGVEQSDGKILAVSGSRGVFRINTDGTFDSGFADNHVAYFEDSDIALQSDQKIVTVGTGHGSRYFIVVHRLNPDGTFDATFDVDGIAIADVSLDSAYGETVCVQPDGKIVVAGMIFDGDRFTAVMARLLSDGTLDSSFAGDGVLTHQVDYFHQWTDVACLSNGHIAIVGTSIVETGRSRLVTAMFNNDGSPDTTFDADGITAESMGYEFYAAAITIQADGNLFIAASTKDEFGAPLSPRALRYLRETPCATAATGCMTPESTSLSLRRSDNPKKRSFQWKWNDGPQTDLASFGDPLISDTYQLCVYSNTNELVLDAQILPSAAWKGSTKGFKYNNKSQSDGLTGIGLSPGADGESKISVKGKGALLTDMQLPLASPPFVVQLRREGWEQCFESRLGTSDVSVNNEEQFKAKY